MAKMSWATVTLALCCAALLQGTAGEMFDVIEARKLPPVECTHGCARWSDLTSDGSDVNQTAVDELWRDRAVQVSANRSCAQPGRSPFADAGTTGGYAGVGLYTQNAPASHSPRFPRVACVSLGKHTFVVQLHFRCAFSWRDTLCVVRIYHDHFATIHIAITAIVPISFFVCP